MIDAATATLQQLLAAAADEATRRHWESYLKGAARFRGVPMAGIRTAVRRTWRDHDLAGAPTTELLTLAQHWFAAAMTEDKLAAVLLLAEHAADRLTVDHVDALAARASEQFSGFTPLVLQLCRDNLVVDDRFAHTGPGWVLRELSRSDPDAVRDFVATEPALSQEARRMALARLRPGPYRRR